ncbi:MAG: hypothetical protein M1833_004090 [Piccolia ochrophora]|nr:MAG: hypothetical protein M1833_004090 [Piccolia ochrophora]
MPPFVARKRRRSSSPPTAQSPRYSHTTDNSAITRGGKSSTPLKAAEVSSNYSRTPEGNKAFLDQFDDDSSDSSLSDISSAEFEDVEPAIHPSKRRKPNRSDEDEDEDHGEEDGEEVAWEDAIKPGAALATGPRVEPSGDLELTLSKAGRTSLSNPHGKKKGPSKIERQIRVHTHCMHVQFLMFHNLIRNAWLCDKIVQKTLFGHLTLGMRKEVERWKSACGQQGNDETVHPEGDRRKGKRGKRKIKGKDARDWSGQAKRVEEGVPNLSRGDPTIRLLTSLVAFWKKRFRITAPGLRKQGYKPLSTLETEIASFQNDPHDSEIHGERIMSLEDFREKAETCEGSRDVGAQLFTALLRGLGLEARMVASLQPVGFGWAKGEDASGKKKRKRGQSTTNGPSSNVEVEEVSEPLDDEIQSAATSDGKAATLARNQSISKKRKVRKSGRREEPIDLSDSPKGESGSGVDYDDMSVIDVTPVASRKLPSLPFDKDLPFPVYWTEVLSPISNRYIPVESISLNTVALNDETLGSFEPRGAKAEKAKQVLAYVVAFASNGTAKDVTTRYLKRHIWPGKTKGVRMPVDRVPVYNHRGKVKKYEDYDWFKSVMSGYSKDAKQRTWVDEDEEERDLKPVKPVKEIKEGEETLQSYKVSADFVLERHLRREEALLPGAKHVKMFAAGKGDKAVQERVFRREDVVACKTSESWHKEGREVKPGEQPMKLVPMRAVTLNRKREIEQAEADGEKMKQGLYSWDQTEWIIPPPIKNGIIPKNAFGNIDCYVPSMVPEGAVHLPYRGLGKICRRMDINHAEAVTGFEFKSQRAVPVVQGVVIAQEKEQLVMDAWQIDEEERVKKEEGKREKLALARWRKFLMGLRIMERVREEYSGDAQGAVPDEINPFTNRTKKQKPAHDGQPHSKQNDPVEDDNAEELPGGFLLHDEGGQEYAGGGGFIPADDETTGLHDGDLVMEDDDFRKSPRHSKGTATPASLASSHGTKQPNFSGTRSSEEENDPGIQQRNALSTTTRSRKSATKPKAKPKAKSKEAAMEPLTDSNTRPSRRTKNPLEKPPVKSPYFELDSEDKSGVSSSSSALSTASSSSGEVQDEDSSEGDSNLGDTGQKDEEREGIVARKSEG